MRIIFGLVLFLGVGLAGLAVTYAKDRMDQYSTALDQQRQAVIETTEVVIVTAPLRYGQTLNRSYVRVIDWPAAFVPMGAFTSIDQVFPPDAEGERMALRAIERNEPLLRAKVTEPGQDAGVASRLGSGMRAFSISVDVTTGVAGFIRPGDRVDVYWTGGGRGERVTRLIQTNLQIIAVDQQSDQDQNNPMLARTITVEAPPERIGALAQAQASGTLSLALVGVGDETESGMVEVGLDDILGITNEPAAPAEVAQAPQVCSVRTRRGGEIQIVPVPCANN